MDFVINILQFLVQFIDLINFIIDALNLAFFAFDSYTVAVHKTVRIINSILFRRGCVSGIGQIGGICYVCCVAKSFLVGNCCTRQIVQCICISLGIFFVCPLAIAQNIAAVAVEFAAT